MKLKFARVQLFSRIARLATAGMFLCVWTTIVPAQTGYNFQFPINLAVPDGNVSGLAVNTGLAGLDGSIANVTVSLDISGGFNGDLYAYLAGPNGGFAMLLNRVGVGNGNPFGYADTGFNVKFDDAISYENIHLYQNYSPTFNGGGQLTGTWATDGRNIDPLSAASVFDATRPTTSLNSFDGTAPNGTWTLYLADLSGGAPNTLVSWDLSITTVPEPSTYALLGIGFAIFLMITPRPEPGTPVLQLAPRKAGGFGSSALRTKGKIFAMISSKGAFVVKLPKQRVDDLVPSGTGKCFDPGHGRLMKEWVELDSALQDSWLDVANEASSFAPKNA